MNPFTVLAESPIPSYQYNECESVPVLKTHQRLVTIPQLFIAVKNGDLKLVRKAFNQGMSADITWKGNTLLNYAIFYNQIEAVKLLIEHGATPSIKSHKYNMNAYEEAAEKQEILKVLYAKIN